MSFLDIIEKKKNSIELNYSEMKPLFKKYIEGEIPEYQMSAFLMAVYFQGMSDEEIYALTKIAMESGEYVDLNAIEGVKVDKHSTGGVGDSTTLVLGPILASCGLNFCKMSGKGLGHTGGTLDKLESIQDFEYELSREELIEITKTTKLVIGGQTANITPLDKKLYDLRNASATVDSIPLIASSIMSKKLAISSDIILIDVKVGEGAFMKDFKQAKVLANMLVNVGKLFGRKTIAILTAMDQPLGQAIGNSIEVEEAIETLKGKGPEDLRELCIYFATKILSIALSIDCEEAKNMAEESIHSGRAIDKLKEMIIAQSGNPSVVDDYSLLPQPKHSFEVFSNKEGYINKLPAKEIGNIARNLGAGRINIEDKLDLAAGVFLEKKCGDRVTLGEKLVTLYGSDQEKLKQEGQRLLSIIEIKDESIERPELILEEVSYDI